MREGTSRLLPFLTALVMSLGLAACAGEQADGDGPDAGALASETSEVETAESGVESRVESRVEGREGDSGEEHAAEGEQREGEEGREGGEEGGEHAEGGEAREGGEHDEGGEGEEHDEGGEGEGEESGVYIVRGATWDAVRRGARLVLSFDPALNAFVGMVENTTGQELCAVRVEVHLSSGTELGPTARTDVQAGGTTAVRLSTEGESFESWTAHPELSSCAGE